MIHHTCCDLCSALCKCESCQQTPFTSELEMNLRDSCKSEAKLVPLIGEDGIRALKPMLLSLHQKVESSDCCLDSGLETGFPAVAIEEILTKQQYLATAEDVWVKTSLFDYALAEKIFNMLEEIRRTYTTASFVTESDREEDFSSDLDLSSDEFYFMPRSRANFHLSESSSD